MTRQLLRNFINLGKSQNFGLGPEVGQGGSKLESRAGSVASSQSIVKLKVKRRNQSNTSSAFNTSQRESHDPGATRSLLLDQVLNSTCDNDNAYENKVRIQFNTHAKLNLISQRRISSNKPDALRNYTDQPISEGKDGVRKFDSTGNIRLSQQKQKLQGQGEQSQQFGAYMSQNAANDKKLIRINFCGSSAQPSIRHVRVNQKKFAEFKKKAKEMKVLRQINLQK